MKTNSEWATAVVAQFTIAGYSPALVSGALSLYLAGKPLSRAQISIANTAVRLEGFPPLAVPAISVYDAYTCARDIYIETGDFDQLQRMIENVRLDDDY